MKLAQKSLAVGLMSAALLGSFSVSARTQTPQTSPSRSFTTDLAKANLAKANLAKEGVTEPTAEQLSAAETSIQAQRDSGMGWGEIAHTMGLNLGAVVSAANRAQPDVAQSAAKADKSTKAGQQGQSAAASGRSSNGGGNSGGNSGGHGGGGRGK